MTEGSALAYSCVITGMTRVCPGGILLRFDGNNGLPLLCLRQSAGTGRPFPLHASEVLVSEGGRH